MIELRIDKQDIELNIDRKLVLYSYGEYDCQFIFDNSWEGFDKLAIFLITDDSQDCLSSEKRFIAPIINNSCLIKKEALESGNELRIGVYGTKGEIKRPTLFTRPIPLFNGAKNTNNLFANRLFK